jgi:hypothetical protein
LKSSAVAVAVAAVPLRGIRQVVAVAVVMPKN